MTTSQDLCRVLSCLDLKQSQVHRLVDTITRWESSCGKEWTVRRLKDMHRFYLFKAARTLDEYKSSSWLRTNEKGLKGPFSVLNGKSLKTQLYATRVYTLFYNQSPTHAQLKKFYTAAFLRRAEPLKNGGRIPMETSEEVHKVYHFVKPTHKWKVKSSPRNLLENYSVSPSKRAPIGCLGSVAQDNHAAWLAHDMGNPFVRSIIRDHKVCADEVGLLQIAYDEEIPRLQLEWERLVESRGQLYDTSIGRLGYIQEAGCKLRAVANPAVSLQILLNPLKKALETILKNDPSVAPADCTFDQNKGVTFALESIQQGKTVYSVDLSNATDSFPLRYTAGVLCDFLDMSDDLSRDSVKAFLRCATRKWYDPHTDSMRSWKKGQPLGLGPSFFAFALSHHSVVRAIEDRLELEPCSTYRILGDDIVINDSRVAESYIQYLTERLGCDVSLDKTLTSPKAAEFAGKVITEDSILQLCKYRQMSDRNFLEVARQLGPKSMNLMRPRQRKVIEIISDIPEWFGGLGWNPKGLPADDRIAKAVDLGFLTVEPETKEVYNPLIPFRRLSNKIFYSTGLSLDRSRSLKNRDRAASDLEALTETADIINSNVGVERDVRENSNWPISTQSGDPRGLRSTLETLEKKVKIKRGGPRLPRR